MFPALPCPACRALARFGLVATWARAAAIERGALKRAACDPPMAVLLVTCPHCRADVQIPFEMPTEAVA